MMEKNLRLVTQMDGHNFYSSYIDAIVAGYFNGCPDSFFMYMAGGEL